MILRGVTFLLTQWDAYVNSILHCVLSEGKFYTSTQSMQEKRSFLEKITHLKKFYATAGSPGRDKSCHC